MKIIISLLAGIFLFVTSCSKLELNQEPTLKGKLIGYLKCTDNENKNTLFGVFIISNNRDSLLAFNVSSSIYDMDITKIELGINFFDGDSISFNYRNIKNDEMKQFDCPPTTMQNPTLYSIENFSQVAITNISKLY